MNRTKLLLLLVLTAISIHVYSQKEGALSKEELAKINRELDNPLAKRWSLVFQENFSINQGDMVEGGVISNSFFFQPALPIPFG